MGRRDPPKNRQQRDDRSDRPGLTHVLPFVLVTFDGRIGRESSPERSLLPLLLRRSLLFRRCRLPLGRGGLFLGRLGRGRLLLGRGGLLLGRGGLLGGRLLRRRPLGRLGGRLLGGRAPAAEHAHDAWRGDEGGLAARF